MAPPDPTDRPAAPAPWADEPSDTRRRLLEGAAEAFGRHGYAATTVAHVLRAGDVSRPSFYKYFRNKEDVFDALFALSSERLVEALVHDVRAAADGPAKLAAAVDALIRFVLETGLLARTFYVESRADRAPAMATRYRGHLDRLTEFFEAESARVGARSSDPLLFVGLVAAVEAVALTLLDEPAPDERAIERRRRAILGILRRTLAT